jgi:hypothetical protein
MKRAYGHTERRENGLKVGKWPRNSEWIALLLLLASDAVTVMNSFSIIFVLCVKCENISIKI